MSRFTRPTIGAVVDPRKVRGPSSTTISAIGAESLGSRASPSRMAVCSPSRGASGVFSGTRRGSKERMRAAAGHGSGDRRQEGSPAHHAKAAHVLVADPRRPALETRGAHPEGAEQAEERALAALDEQPVLDPAHAVDEEDPHGARGLWRPHRLPGRPLDLHVDVRRTAPRPRSTGWRRRSRRRRGRGERCATSGP